LKLQDIPLNPLITDMGNLACGVRESAVNSALSSTDYEPYLHRFLLSNLSTYFSSEGLSNVSCWHPALKSTCTALNRVRSREIRVRRLLEGRCLHALALVVYYTLENGYDRTYVQGVHLLVETLGQDTQWDFFVLKLLVGLKFPTEAGDMSERLWHYSKSVQKALERKLEDLIVFEATEVGCFALALALDPTQLPAYHSLFGLLLAGFSSIQCAQDRSAILYLVQVLICKQVQQPYLKDIQQVLELAGCTQQYSTFMQDQEIDSSVEEDGLLIDNCLCVGIESLEIKAFSMLKTVQFQVNSALIGAVFQPRQIVRFVQEFCADPNLSETALDMCMQQYMQLLRNRGTSLTELNQFLQTLLDSLDFPPTVYIDLQSAVQPFFHEMLNLSIVSPIFTQRYLDHCLEMVISGETEDWSEIAMYFSHCIAKLQYRETAIDLIEKLIEVVNCGVRLPLNVAYLVAICLHLQPPYLAAIQEKLQSYPKSKPVQKLLAVLSTSLPRTQFPDYFRALVCDLDNKFDEFMKNKRALDDYIQQLAAEVRSLRIARLPSDYFSTPIADCTKLFVRKLKGHLKAIRRQGDLSSTATTTYREEARLLHELICSNITEVCISSSEVHIQLLVLSLIGQVLYEAFEDASEKPLTSEVVERVYQEILQAYASPCKQPAAKTRTIIKTVTKSVCLHSAMRNLSLDTYCLEDFMRRVYVTNVVKNAYAITTFGGYVFLNSCLQQANIDYTSLLYITIAHEAAHCSMRVHLKYYDALSLTEERPTVAGCPGASQTYTTDLHCRECGDQIEEQLFGCKVTMLTLSQCKFLTNAKYWDRLDLGDFKAYLHSCVLEGNPAEIRYLPKKATAGLMALREKCTYRGR